VNARPAGPDQQPAPDAVVRVRGLTKTYASGFQALKGIDLDIRRGEIFALLGPNGAGKTTLISILCGIVNPTSGTAHVDGHDVVRDYRAARSRIGLVPQELTTDVYETVRDTVNFSRGLFGKPPDATLVERILRDLALWEKRDAKIMTLSGGMKRRLMIARALLHEPRLLILDEPTAGVDIEIRRSMWEFMRKINEAGTTIILTTHYIEEAEAIADRVGVINKGELLLVEDKAKLMARMGKKQLSVMLSRPITAIPPALARHNLDLNGAGDELVYTYDTHADRTGITKLLNDVAEAGLVLRDVATRQSSLEEIFVTLVKGETP